MTTLRRVLLARSCAIKGEDVVREVKGVDSRAGGVGGRTIATICSQFWAHHCHAARERDI